MKYLSRAIAAMSLTAAVLVGCGAMPPSNMVSLGGSLTASAEVPPNGSTGTGTVQATLDKQSRQLKWKVTYSGLSGPVAAGHFHGPAAAGQNAGVSLGFKGSMDSPIEGEATLTEAQAADVLSGKWYVNLHTKANPGGEVRAQVLVK